MNVLGVHLGHDSSAALVHDGRIVADVAEERFVRVKHYSGLPVRSIEYCLGSRNLTMDDIDVIAIPAVSFAPALHFLFDVKGTKELKTRKRIESLARMRQIGGGVMSTPPLYMKTFPASPRTEILHVEHHLAHAASAYYTSGSRDKQLIVTIDGAGDGVSVGLWRGENGAIERLDCFPTSASIGWFYSNVTEALGWWHGDGEGKTMGLAPYGDFTKCEGVLDKFYPKFENGSVREHHEFGPVGMWNEGGAIHYHFDDAYEIRDLISRHGRENIAAEAQRVLEDQVQQIVYPWLKKENTRNLSAAGGVMLNVKLNQRLWESGGISRHHTYPNAGDSGIAAGAALYAYFSANPDAPIHPIHDLYLGPEYSASDVEDSLKLRQIEYRQIDNPAEVAAEALANDKIVGWFQGRMESGPRALGNRSIVMSANRAENKDILNERVKFREAFRPFCPSLLAENQNDYLENAREEPFMITSFTCKPEKRDKVPAVVHVDNTLRPQAVKKETNPRFWNLIREFGSRSGEPLVLNTSFNVMGEPIVNHPRDAVRCFFDTGLDMLVIGDFVLEKRAK